MKRSSVNEISAWKLAPNRKPLIIQGARQVGKTWIMKEFGRTEFNTTVYVNFEKEVEMRSLFEQNYDPNRIIKTIEAYYNQEIIPGETLLILDEIQEAKGALTSLKYFNEERPDLHVICAGSLLGIALGQQTSFPVGQVAFLRLNPLSFIEFLWATGNERFAQLIEKSDWEGLSFLKPRLTELLKSYFFVGGMPEAVFRYSQTQNYQQVREIQDAILTSYEQDFAKHAPVHIIPKIRLIWNTLVNQLAKENKKFMYGLLREGARAKEYEHALHWLEDYGLIHRVCRVNNARFPLSAYMELATFKMYHLDIGLLCAQANLHSKVLVAQDALFSEFKGALTEQYVLQQLKAEGLLQVYYWTSSTGTAELDFILERRNSIIPLEVKASENLQSKSLKVFSTKFPALHCYRTSMSNFKKESWITNVPLAAVTRIIEMEGPEELE
jgi:predicted AAA+ superfamily ATPase